MRLEVDDNLALGWKNDEAFERLRNPRKTSTIEMFDPIQQGISASPNCTVSFIPAPSLFTTLQQCASTKRAHQPSTNTSR